MRQLKEIPRRQRFATHPALGRLFGIRAPTDLARRNEIMGLAHLKYGYSLSEIGQALACTIRRSAAS